jgi:hypothetical protein
LTRADVSSLAITGLLRTVSSMVCAHVANGSAARLLMLEIAPSDRELCPNPDVTRNIYVEGVDPADQVLAHAYDHVDIPPIKPVTTRINLFRAVIDGKIVTAYWAAYQSIAGAGHAVAEMSERVAHQWGLRFRGRPQPQRRSCLCRVATAH